VLERGITVAQGRRRLAGYLSQARGSDDASALQISSRIRQLIEDMRAQWHGLDQRIAAFDAEFVLAARSEVSARRLSTIPGIGAINATALVAAVGDARSLARARDLAAWLGLVPRQATTGGRPRLLDITKRGNKYLRTLLIHGARAALPSLVTAESPLGNWLRGLSARAHRNTVIVALASKLARIAWAVLRSSTTYNAATDTRPVAAQARLPQASIRRGNR
jgi:transposase